VRGGGGVASDLQLRPSMTNSNRTKLLAARLFAITLFLGATLLALPAQATDSVGVQETTQVTAAEGAPSTGEGGDYAAREQQSEALAGFKGGDTVVVLGGTTLAVVLLVVLILVII
jgi:hypothetical protein